jgi:hypothetical protein
MKCKHCGTEHLLNKVPCDWPENWSPERAAQFVKDVGGLLGIGPDSAPAMAVEVEKINRQTQYTVTERDLLSWLNETHVISQRLRLLAIERAMWLGWAAFVGFGASDGLGTLLLKLFCLCLFGLPLLAITLPIRITFALRRRRIMRDLHPYFIDWVKQHREPKG